MSFQKRVQILFLAIGLYVDFNIFYKFLSYNDTINMEACLFNVPTRIFFKYSKKKCSIPSGLNCLRLFIV